jgi:hypothetical protein
MSDFCNLILQTIFTHDDKAILELALQANEPGYIEAQAAIYAAAEGNMKETIRYGFEAVYIRAEAFNRDGEAARKDSRYRHIQLMLDEGHKFIEAVGGNPADRGDLIH